MPAHCGAIEVVGAKVGEQLEVAERDEQRRRARRAEGELGLGRGCPFAVTLNQFVQQALMLDGPQSGLVRPIGRS
jgi:hypothetical protein